MNVITAPIKNTLKFLDQKFIYIALRLALVVYVITLLPKVSDDIIEFIESPIGKLLIFTFIITIYVKDQDLALLMAFVLIVILLDYHNNKFPRTVVDASGNVIGTVLKGSTDIAKNVGEASSKLFGVSGRTVGDVVKTVGKGTSDIIGVASELSQKVVETTSTVTGDVVKKVSETVQELGTSDDKIEAFDNNMNGCGGCSLE